MTSPKLNLPGALERALKAEPDGWDPSVLHVSDLRHALIGDGCRRQLWLRIHGAKAKDDSLGTRLMFDHGRRIHERTVALMESGLKRTGWKIVAVERSVSKELRASGLGPERGRLDVELEHRSGMRVVLDMKTVRGRAFKYLPKRPHALQVATYAMMRDAAGGLLLYVDREGQNAAVQFPIPRDDDTVRRAARVCLKTIERKDPPPPLALDGKGKTPWQCQYCGFYGVSCEGPGQDLGADLRASLEVTNGRRNAAKRRTTTRRRRK